MPEDMPSPTPPASSESSASPTPFDIGEEFGTAKKNLPPAKIVLIGIAVLAVVAAIASFIQKPRQQATGAIDNIVTVGVPDQNQVLVAMAVSIHNQGKKTYVIHNIKADLEAGGGTFSDDAASAVDFDRYFQAFPALKVGALDPLKLETRVEPGQELKGTVIVSFPVTPDAFNGRKSLKVTISPADQPLPLVLSK